MGRVVRGRYLLSLLLVLLMIGAATAGEGGLRGTGTGRSNVARPAATLDTLLQEKGDVNGGSSPGEDLLTGTETVISTGYHPGLGDYSPAIYRDRIAWWGADPVNSTRAVILYNISTGVEEVLALAGDATFLAPAISERYATWQETDPQTSMVRVGVYDLKNRTKIVLPPVPAGVNRQAPAISGDRVVWNEEDIWNGTSQIVLFNVTNGSSLRLSPDNANLYPVKPAICDDIASWFEYDLSSGGFTLRAESLETGVLASVGLNITDWPVKGPAISGHRVVWTDIIDGNYQVFLLDTTTPVHEQISTGQNGCTRPDIWNDRVAWVNGSVETGRICLYNLSDRTTSYVVPPDAGTGQTKPAIYGDRIVWEDNRKEETDIYLFTLGTPAAALIAGFSSNVTMGSAPLTVRFNDTTSGDPSTWNWNFGDGTFSTKQSPMHVYLQNGTYTVSLTVSTPFFRNASTLEDLVWVGSPPDPDFSGNVTSGIEPLMVHFQDNSTGSPTGWTWDFGDNSTSSEQSPDHLYIKPGRYSVSLTTGNTFGNRSVRKPGFIQVLKNESQARIPDIPGVEITRNGTYLRLNTTEYPNYTFNRANTLELNLPPECNFSRLTLYSGETGFIRTGDMIAGNITSSMVDSCTIVLDGVRMGIVNPLTINFSVGDPGVFLKEPVTLTSIEGSIPQDYSVFFDATTSDVAQQMVMSDVAYEVKFLHPNNSARGPAALTFGAAASWVRQATRSWVYSSPPGATVLLDGVSVGVTPLEIQAAPGQHHIRLTMNGYHDIDFDINPWEENLKVVRIGDDGTSSVLPVSYAGSGPDGAVDLLRVDSPEGLSTFGLVSGHRTPNIFQLIAKEVESHSPGGLSGGGGGGGGGGYSGSGNVIATPVATSSAHTNVEPIPQNPVQDVLNIGLGLAEGGSQEVPGEPGGPADKSIIMNKIPEAPVISPGSSIFTTLLQVIAVISAVSITIVAIHMSRRRGGDR
ncbi:MAG: PKD domain-containing protein [Methanoregulaceae archaeon]|nr:PKD domain-containing protein [Methanoregulaceae archaeon]